MINNVNNVYTTIKNIEFDQIPEISDGIIDIYAEFILEQNKPKDVNLCLKSRVKDLNDLNDVIEKAKTKSTFHKVMSLSLLAASISVLAAAILLGCLVNPIFIMLSTAGIVTTITAHLLDGPAFHHPEFHIDGPGLPIGILESMYVYDAFKGVDNLERKMIAKTEGLASAIEPLKKLIENKSLIKEGIQGELNKTNIMDLNANVNFNRIQALREAVTELNKAEALLKKLESASTIG